MNPASLAFGTFSFAEALLRTYEVAAKFVRDVKGFEGDRESLVARLTAEKAVTLRLRDLLFARIPSADDASLFERLDEHAQGSLHLIFGQFAKVIEKYLPLDKRYQLSETTSAGYALVSLRMSELALGNRTTTQERIRLGRTSALRWAIHDKKRLADFLHEFEMWNKKITQLVELHLLYLQVHHPSEQQFDVRSKPEVQYLGIGDAMAAQSKALPSLTAPPDTALPELENFQKSWTDLKRLRKPASHWTLELGQFYDDFVVVDSKRYDGTLSATERAIAFERLNQLASILQNLHAMEDVIPQCLCWMERLDKGAFSLLFRVPPKLEPRPQSLFDLLPERSQSAGPLLDERLEIAYRLASAIDRLHSVSWIHKNIRSENILFYHPKTSPAEAQNNEERLLPTEWFLYGFEYARPMDTDTSFKADTNFLRNVYRHPQRWGVPTESFTPIHDLYALGVVLLELGLWREAPSIVKQIGTRPPDPFQVRNNLIERARNHLGYSASSAYRDLVLRCLQGHFEVDLDDGHLSRVRLASQFRSLVVDELRSLAFPRLAASQQLRIDGWTSDQTSAN
jgi:hypothetical protein